MQYIEREASYLYFKLTEHQLLEGILSRSHCLDRLSALKDMCKQDDPIYKIVSGILEIEDWDGCDKWCDETNEDHEAAYQREISPLKESDTRKGIAGKNERDMHFVSNQKGLKDWVFHQYDVDFHPSIPHGHFLGRNHPKLDAYLGWVYKGSKQINRLARSLIIDLWNDPEFRIFSERSIRWYLNEFPNYNWRVNDPLRLPRRG
ncbi:hypothetical protein CGI93_23430 [Vibrio parahaemolyticus]|uniref:hypothetical protein n=1 Tax=Vibrio parahaemolyticus TaxID=670 RepID=UPI001123E1D1|nr:hypothetical protein [Vibrio parahaemolyticus]TOG79772.1 hypothetical protein CGI93_23430 [Vibrio parahaemolyticus]HCK0618602.1 hypothetical protein [Vibrio parahaemolyticus]